MTDLNLPMDVIQPEPPQPLITDQLAPQAPFPVAALGRILAPAAQAIAEGVQVPLSMAAGSVLAAAALPAQGHANILIDGRLIPISVFFISIAPSGQRKSAADDVALKAHKKYQKKLFAQYKEDFEKYKDEKDTYDRAREALLRQIKGGEGVEPIKAELAALERPIPPLQPYILVDDPTIDALLKALLFGQSSMGLFSGEGAVIFGGHSMKPENLARTVAALSLRWDGAVLTRNRVGDNESSIRYGCRLTVYIQIQPVIAKEVLANSIMQGQGFLARFLISWPESLAGTRLYRQINLSTDPRMLGYWQRMTQLLEQTPQPENGEDEPPRQQLKLTPEAQALWIAEYNRIEGQLGRLGDLSDIEAWGSKAAEQILRIAGVLAVTDGHSSIGADVMDCAIELGRWYLGEALRLCHPTQQDPDLVAAQKLIDWLHSKGWTEFDCNKLGKSGPSFVRSSKQRDKLLAILHKARHLMSEDGKNFRINPLSVADSADFAEAQQIRAFPLAEDLRMTAEDLRKSQTSAENPQASAKHPQPETRVNTELPQNPQFPQSFESENPQPDIEAI
ncbi:uncharacterized protein DUF3987 [Azomonas agilis]|uniref:Uncharacterized protein DUF3987 n=1 Tax=Azomonas agilis TaxID=116849 RepID=A0A562IZ19_9GAMM|nr:YfjI family protein [Azomonas agilis]TWH76259.1 uncharacterized protein DUF3987 [Azomonas agilis]